MAKSTGKLPPHPPHTPSLEALVQLATDLDLTGLAAALPAILARAVQDSLSYTDFVLALLQAETAARRTRSIDRGLKQAHIGTVEGLDGYDFGLRPQLDARIVKELCNGQFIQECRNVICLGKPGLGKTRICRAIIHAACMDGYSALCVITADMLMELHAAQADHTYKRALRKYVKPEVLLLDEFGYEPFDSQATSHLYRVVSARHKTGSIVIAANCGFSAWKKLFPSEDRAVATVDRLVDEATILRFTGETCRKPREISGAPLDD
jgi:DNA replication protein DnaC